MAFWIIISVLALVVAALLVMALVRGHVGAEPAAAYDLRVYRDQLSEVERDIARGVVAAEDGERVRTEVSRRILAADAAMQADAPAAEQPKTSMAIGTVVLIALVGGSIWLYQNLGAPDYGDFALSDRIAAAKEAHDTRPSQSEFEAKIPPTLATEQPAPEFLALMVQLREAVSTRPNDLQGHVLLARNEASLGNFSAAYKAQEKVLALKGEAANAQDFVDFADLMILATGGYISPEAELALKRALDRDPKNGAARYYVGQMMAQTGRIDVAFRMWEALLNEGPADAPWIAPIRAQIESAASMAGVDFEMPEGEGLSGPSADDVAAASDMNAEDRQEMIRGMVGQLSERLASEGGTPSEWARLIGAYGVLGETGRAQEIWVEAQQVFETNPAALSEIRAAAKNADLVQ